eukprot:CAMPEP_0177698174 /NCGR_PEP_ID=MMETSP0484_2-20121128/4899_1 /TAXON_ID=354590 /ORGANISM="Rhodomonas lens, Strain RHODO" /LENGTH=192 /DNA_ID=CAMNT_0019209247 /DNA_START=252 /DNA_END=831 /DNA_ORIENTATION=-
MTSSLWGLAAPSASGTLLPALSSSDSLCRQSLSVHAVPHGPTMSFPAGWLAGSVPLRLMLDMAEMPSTSCRISPARTPARSASDPGANPATMAGSPVRAKQFQAARDARGYQKLDLPPAGFLFRLADAQSIQHHNCPPSSRYFPSLMPTHDPKQPLVQLKARCLGQIDYKRRAVGGLINCSTPLHRAEQNHL